MRVSVFENFKIQRWIGFCFFQNSESSGVKSGSSVWRPFHPPVNSKHNPGIAEPTYSTATKRPKLPARVGVHDLANYHDRYPHIWDGEYAKAFEGAYCCTHWS